MFKVNFKTKDCLSVNFFKIFKTKDQADTFIRELGDSFVSVKVV
jgi:hypothetical protein